MKKIKKILASAVSMAVIVSALAVPTAADITPTQQTKTERGTFTIDGKTYSYGGDLVASTTYARASVGSGHNMNLLVRVTAESIKYNGKTLTNTEVDGGPNTALTVEVDNIFDVGSMTITSNIRNVDGKYGIGGISFDLNIK